MSPSHIWQAVLGQLELQVSRPVFDTWLAGTRATSLDGPVLLVEAPNPFIVESIEKRMYQTVMKSVHSVVGPQLEVRFYVSSLEDTRVNALELPPAPNEAPRHTLNDQYTFATFVAGPSNQLALSAAQAVAESPGATYNPLFIYAPPGLGKTHLMHAIAHSSHRKGMTVQYITSEGFTNEFIRGIRNKTTDDFRSRYRSVDMLLVDDIQFLEGKHQTLEGFFHTVNDLHTAQKQVILASELPPQRLGFLDTKLRSRLESGLTAYLQVPDAPTRLSILRSKATAMGIHAEEDALTALAAMDIANVRELEGAFNRAVALATLRNTNITPTIASEAIDTTSPPPSTTGPHPNRTLTPEQVISAILNHYSITRDQLTGRKRNRVLASARQATIHIMSSQLRMGVTDISKAIGRDHSTVSLTLKRLSRTLPSDPALQSDINTVNGLLLQKQRRST